jgi:glucose/mannose transport system permease protein
LRRGLVRTLIYATLALFAVVWLLPAFVVIANAFRTSVDVAERGWIAFPLSFSLNAFRAAWSTICVSGTCAGIKANFLNSLLIALPATAVSTALGALNGYVLSQWRFRGADLVFFLMLLGVFMPFQTTLLPWAAVLSRLGLYDSVAGLILIHSVQGIAFATLFCRAFFARIPADLVKAARIDGAGFWRIFVRIMLPLAPPILAVTIIWQFTSIWNEYLFGMVFTKGTEQPITVALMGAGAGSQSATVLIAALPPLLLFLASSRAFTRLALRGAVAGM